MNSVAEQLAQLPERSLRNAKLVADRRGWTLDPLSIDHLCDGDVVRFNLAGGKFIEVSTYDTPPLDNASGS